MATHLKEIKQCVTFIFVKNDKGDFVANGTGFFVGVKNETNPDIYTPYLVTAKHVLQDKEGKIFPEVAIRLNKKDGTSQATVIPLGGDKGARVHIHEDKDVDIALFNCLLVKMYMSLNSYKIA